MESQIEAFDLRVEIKDPVTGAIVKVQPYVRHHSAEEGLYYERPTGIFWRENGETYSPKAKLPNTNQVKK